MDHLTLLPLLAQLEPGRDVSLRAFARKAGLSQFHLQRLFRAHLRETPRRYAERRRLEHAAGQLLVTESSILTIALSVGYQSHEVFSRAFRRHFGCAPAAYRLTALRAVSRSERTRHFAWVRSIGGCIHLFHCPSVPAARIHRVSTPAISRQDRPGQPLLVIKRRIARSELQAMLAECFGTLFSHGLKAGLPIAGAPLARFLAMGPGLWTVEAAMPLAAPAAAMGEIQPAVLPEGPVAVALHIGPYEQLSDTHAAIERFIEAGGLEVAGAPWESYLTDPAQHPSPQDWRTEVCWPLVR